VNVITARRPRLITQWFHQQERRAAPTDFALTGELLHDALAEVERELVNLLAGEAGADVEAVVNAVQLANGWPARAHTLGSIPTRRTKFAEAPNEHRAARSGSVRQAMVELARRRRAGLRAAHRSGMKVREQDVLGLRLRRLHWYSCAAADAGEIADADLLAAWTEEPCAAHMHRRLHEGREHARSSRPAGR
jgi:hypothetical protein